MNFQSLYLLFLLFSISTFSEEQKKVTFTEKVEAAATDTKEKIIETSEKIQKSLNETRGAREEKKYFGYLNYSPLDLFIFSKYGATFGTNKNVDTSWEFEYLRGSFSVPSVIKDIGKMVDERYSIIRRSYMGNNSFNISYGVTLFSFSVKIGDELLNRLNSNYPSIDVMEMQSLGVNFGIGNRWNFKQRYSISIDWFSIAQPLFTTKEDTAYLDHATNQDDRDDVEKAKKLIAYFPRLTFLKLQFGMLF